MMLTGRSHLLLGCLLMVSACKIPVGATIYTSDVQEVVATKQRMPVELLVSFETTSGEECLEMHRTMVPVLLERFPAASAAGCVDSFPDNFAQFRVETSLVYRSEGDAGGSSEPIYLGATEEGGRVHVYFFANDEAISKLESSVPSEMSMFSSGKHEMLLTATVNNDLPDIATIKSGFVFFNGTAQYAETETELVRRQTVEIALADVANASFLQGDGWAAIFSMATPGT